MKGIKGISVAAFFIVVLIIAAVIWQRQSTILKEDFKIRVGYKPNYGYQNYLIAEEEGFFSKHKIEVEGVSFESTDLMMQALALGQIDATPAGSIEVIAALEERSPNTAKAFLTLVFTKDNPYYTILVPTSSSMQTMSDLRGKKVGTNPGSTATSWLTFCLKRVTDPAQVQIIPLQPQLQLQALIGGQIDALYCGDPTVTIALQRGIARVLVKGPENQYMFDPMATGAGVLSSAFIKAKPKTARRFIAAMNETIDFMRTNEVESRRILTERAKLDKTIAEKVSLIGYWKLEETEFPLVQKYLDYLRAEGILKQALKAENLYLARDWEEK